MKYDLTWGESVAVRKAFMDQVNIGVHFNRYELMAMDYTPFNGDADLILETANVIKRQTGQKYKHIFLTNGASGGCTIALRAYQILGKEVGYTNPPPYFPLYPNMMKAAGLIGSYKEGLGPKYVGNGVFLLDTPANPTGQHVFAPDWAWSMPIIWDAVYHNNVYMSLSYPAPRHEVVVGSYSKLTGLNGIRLGWIATNDDAVAGVINEIISAEYCGLSKPSKTIMLQLLNQMNQGPKWDDFEQNAKTALDDNRYMWSKLERYFNGTPVPVNGMFYYAQMDDAAKKLFEKAGVLWQVGSKMGTDDSFGRFNIGQDTIVILQAVRAVLKEDKA